MPCNSDYMNPTNWEMRVSQVLCLLEELGGNLPDPHHWGGYHPQAYNKGIEKRQLDAWVSELCSKLKEVDVTQYSLEMQLWWREHQKADAKRIAEEKRKEEWEQERQEALNMLTPHQRKVLGLE